MSTRQLRTNRATIAHRTTTPSPLLQVNPGRRSTYPCIPQRKAQQERCAIPRPARGITLTILWRMASTTARYPRTPTAPRTAQHRTQRPPFRPPRQPSDKVVTKNCAALILILLLLAPSSTRHQLDSIAQGRDPKRPPYGRRLLLSPSPPDANQCTSRTDVPMYTSGER